MHRINAYVLAADPAWLESSILSYYDHIDQLIVCYDAQGKAWSGGGAIRSTECIDRIQAIDRDKKVRLLPGHFARESFTPMENDTHQRRTALAEAGKNADWVLQIDTDEVFPDASDFIRRLREEVPDNVVGVDWPLRPIFKQISATCFLEVCRRSRRRHMEFSGGTAVRSGVELRVCRHPIGQRWRYDVRPSISIDSPSGTILGAPPININKAAIHFSWARTESELRSKLASWGHSKEFDGGKYLDRVWRPANWKWPFLYDFHPIYRGTWPALRPTWIGEQITRGMRTDR